MEEKYSFLEKKIALEKYIKNKNKKNHTVKQIPNLETKTKSETCLYCLTPLEEDGLFCSDICKTIFYSNMQKIIPTINKQVRFVPFELLTAQSKEMYRELVNKKRLYDKFQVLYSYFVQDNKKYIKSTFKFIYKFEIVETIIQNFELNFAYAPTTENISYICLENGFEDLFEKKCLFCSIETTNHVIRIDKSFITGYVCSVFCFKSFMTFIETHINHPFKYFFTLPCLSLLSNPKKVLKYKNNVNCQNSVFETEYYETNQKELRFSINIISY